MLIIFRHTSSFITHVALAMLVLYSSSDNKLYGLKSNLIIFRSLNKIVNK